MMECCAICEEYGIRSNGGEHACTDCGRVVCPMHTDEWTNRKAGRFLCSDCAIDYWKTADDDMTDGSDMDPLADELYAFL